MPTASPGPVPRKTRARPATAARAFEAVPSGSVVCAVLAVAVLLPLEATAFERAVEVAAGERVQIEIDFGDGLRPDPGFVRIASHDGDRVRARVDTTGWGQWDVEVALARRPGGARLDVRARGTVTWMFGGPNIRVDVFVPRDVRVDVISWGGAVRIEDLQGSVRGTMHDAGIIVNGVDGRVKLRVEQSGTAEIDDVSGDLDVDSEAGNVQASRIAGSVEIRSSDGAIEVADARGPITAKSLDGAIDLSGVAGPVTARSERGDVHVRFAAPTGGAIESDRGDVAVEWPQGEGAELDARSLCCPIDLATRGFEGRRGGEEVIGKIGAGGPSLVIRSSRGKIRVSQR